MLADSSTFTDDQHLVVAIFNDRIEETPTSAKFADGLWQGDVEILSKSAVVLRLRLEAADNAEMIVRSVRQIPIPEKLLTITPEEPLETIVRIPDELRSDITAARVRFAMINRTGTYPRGGHGEGFKHG